MRIRGNSNPFSAGYLVAPLALLLCASPAVCGSKPSSAPKAPAAKPSGGGGSHGASGGASHGASGGASHGASGGASHGPTTSSHGPTTSSHGPTTSSHGPTTSSHGATTTSGHTTTTAGGAGHTAGGAGHTGTTAGGAGHTTTTAGGAGHTGTTAGGAGHTGTTAGGAGHTTTAGGAGHTAGGTTAAGGHTGTTAGAGHTGAAGAGGAHSGTTAGAGHTGGAGAAGGHTGTTAGAGAGHTGAAGGGGKTFGAGSHTQNASAQHPHTVGGSQVAKSHSVVQTKGGNTVVKRPGGRVATVHDTKRGVDVHHGLNGNRRVVAERRDHSRVVAERGGRGYVQRPYRYHGHEYARRSYYYHGHYYHAYYGRYYYHGVYVNPYYPAYYYPPAYYGWVYNPWVTPVAYGWGWAGNPWYGYYGAYFTPYPVYASASLWLTDYIISTSLMAAYQARVDAQAQAAALNGAAPLTPEVKQLIADEVKNQIAIENSESKTSNGGEPDAASSSVQRLLDDGHQHVFVAGADLDVVDEGGNECALSEGDAIQLAGGQIAPDATAVNLAVLSSKGGNECAKGNTVAVQLADLQEMQNHMRQTIDQGMQELQKKQGQGGLPAAPAAARTAPVESAMASSAPPPPAESEVAAEINQEGKEADVVEKEDTNEAVAGPNDTGAASAETPTINVGQSVDEVVAALGQPTKKAALGAKQIYFYKDLKVTFQNGKVSDVN